jgi:hypothetical protein
MLLSILICFICIVSSFVSFLIIVISVIEYCTEKNSRRYEAPWKNGIALWIVLLCIIGFIGTIIAGFLIGFTYISIVLFKKTKKLWNYKISLKGIKRLLRRNREEL